MRSVRRSPGIIIAVLLFSGNASAVSLTGDVIYKKVDMFSGSVHFTDNFTVQSQGVYRATLTDFEFPNPFTSSGLNITTATDSLGKLLGPGSVTFDAAPGDYFVSMFASVASMSAEQKNSMIKADLKKHAQERWGTLTEVEKQTRRESRKSRSPEQRKKSQEKAWARAERRVEEQLANLDDFGQYGIQIALVETDAGYPGDANGAAVVPLPGALWLFGTGLIGLLGFGRKSGTHS
jgi:hypothetical protein